MVAVEFAVTVAVCGNSNLFENSSQVSSNHGGWKLDEKEIELLNYEKSKLWYVNLFEKLPVILKANRL